LDLSLLLEYGGVLLILIALEGILAADNALVLAVMVKDLPTKKQQKQALFYGLVGAFVFRFVSLFIIVLLIEFWAIQAIGAFYLLYIAINHLFKKYVLQKAKKEKEAKASGFWWTVLKVELADIAFAVDSILAAVAIAYTVTPYPSDPSQSIIPGLNGILPPNISEGQFILIFLGGFFGLIIMRFAANFFVELLHKKPALETTAFLLVGWVGVKLLLVTLANKEAQKFIADGLESLGLFVKSPQWKVLFWVIFGLIALIGYFGWPFKKKPKTPQGTKKITSSKNELNENISSQKGKAELVKGEKAALKKGPSKTKGSKKKST